jgi:hypothetical protein
MAMTMRSPFDNLCGPTGPLAAEPPDAKEFAGLRQRALSVLHDAQRTDLGLESRFDLAYNAAHALCNAALRHAGYRARQRYIVFQALPHTLGLGPDHVRFLAKCHELRNLGVYEGDLNVTERLAADLLVACRQLADALDRLPTLESAP